jgi:hypothetical protein
MSVPESRMLVLVLCCSGNSAGATSYAIDAKGTASLAGVPNFTLTGDLSARVNTTGSAVDRTIEMPSGPAVRVQFGATDAAAVFSGQVTADIGGFATVSGAFSASKSENQLKVAAAAVTAFVGAGDTGLRVSGGNLGLIVNTDSKGFAAVAGGTVSLVGIQDFSISGSASVRINRLNAPVNETIRTPGVMCW